MNILEFAISMETEGENFYREQAKTHIGKPTHLIFLSLADDENIHAGILRNKLTGLSYELTDSSLSSAEAIFKDKDSFKIETKPEPDQLDSYRMALEKESESIALYKRLLSEADDISEIDLFGYLIEQEENHYTIIENMILLLDRAESWVESAEFGVREEY